MKIAVVGLGTMGGPMARNLIAVGHDVVVHNRTRIREEPLVAAGATAAASPADAARGVEIVLTCVSDTPDAREVLLDPDHGAIAGLAAGSLVIDCSTIAPGATREIAEALASHEVDFVDAPVSGGSEGAIKGTLAIMCGGTEAAFERARPVLEVVGGRVTRVGPVGAGQVTKAVNQVVIAGTYQALAEGIALACRAGVDPRKAIDAIRAGAAGSWVLENRADNMIQDEYPLGFRLQLHRKDLGIALDTARDAGVTMPLAELVAAAEDALLTDGFGDEDMSTLARRVRRASDVPDGPM